MTTLKCHSCDTDFSAINDLRPKPRREHASLFDRLRYQGTRLQDKTTSEPTTPKTAGAETSTVGVGVRQAYGAEKPSRFDHPSRWKSTSAGETRHPLVTAVTAEEMQKTGKLPHV